MKELAAANQAAARRDYRGSAVHLEQAVAIDRTYAVAYVNLGVRYLQCGRPLGARGALLRAIELDPGLVFAYTNLAVADLNLGNPEAAVEAGLSALRVEPGNELARRVVEAAKRQSAQFRR
jgi:tetratricopeptide (TPR) repeat protein